MPALRTTCLVDFYPRPPRGGRPAPLMLIGGNIMISIHALREEGDQIQHIILRLIVDFYPRPPRGGRQESPRMASSVSVFLSTPSARRATADCT